MMFGRLFALWATVGTVFALSSAGDYFKAAGAANCPEGAMVDTEGDCRLASLELSIPKGYRKAVDSRRGEVRPSGCFWDKNGHSYFNRHLQAHPGRWGGVGAICKTMPVPSTSVGGRPVVKDDEEKQIRAAAAAAPIQDVVAVEETIADPGVRVGSEEKVVEEVAFAMVLGARGAAAAPVAPVDASSDASSSWVVSTLVLAALLSLVVLGLACVAQRRYCARRSTTAAKAPVAGDEKEERGEGVPPGADTFEVDVSVEGGVGCGVEGLATTVDSLCPPPSQATPPATSDPPAYTSVCQFETVK